MGRCLCNSQGKDETNRNSYTIFYRLPVQTTGLGAQLLRALAQEI